MAQHFRFIEFCLGFLLLFSLVSCLQSPLTTTHTTQGFASASAPATAWRKLLEKRTEPKLCPLLLRRVLLLLLAEAVAAAAAAAAVVISVRREWTSPASDMRTDWCWDAMPTVRPPPYPLHHLTTQATHLCAPLHNRHKHQFVVGCPTK